MLHTKFHGNPPGSSSEQTMIARSARCYISNFVEISLLVLEKIFKGFYNIWAWRPSRSCDPDAVNKLSLPLPKEATHKILFRLPEQFGRCLKLWTDDGRTDARSWLSYKLTW